VTYVTITIDLLINWGIIPNISFFSSMGLGILPNLPYFTRFLVKEVQDQKISTDFIFERETKIVNRGVAL
jgi:hypothetical protein